MVRSKSDISNQALRVFLQDVGKIYDESRKLKHFIPTKSQNKEILDYFGNECCYCKKRISIKTMYKDHLIPMNKTSLGLNSWGNVVPCCNKCNTNKHKRDWREYLSSVSPKSEFSLRKQRIESFVEHYKYKLDVNNLKEIANNLYEDIGEVSQTLIKLRLKQAKHVIDKMLK